MITIIKDIPLINDVFNYDVILVGTSINNALGNGFQRQVKINFPIVDEVNKSTNYGDVRKLGTVKVINGTPIFCLCYINKSKRRPDLNPEYLDYESLENCLKLINSNFQGKRIASTILGLSDYEGNGNKEKILEIFNKHSNNVDLYLYDYEQKDYEQERKDKWFNIVNQIDKITTLEYREMKKKFHWEQAFGIFKPMPENITEHQIKQIIKQNKGSN
jgi:hypothetical protein